MIQHYFGLFHPGEAYFIYLVPTYLNPIPLFRISFFGSLCLCVMSFHTGGRPFWLWNVMKNKLPQWSKSIQKSEVKVPDMSFHLPLY